MNLKVPGAILPLGCAILSTRAKTIRGVVATPLRRTRVKLAQLIKTPVRIPKPGMKTPSILCESSCCSTV